MLTCFILILAAGIAPNTICEELNLCESIPFPCENGGTCKQTFKSFECVCPPGFSGKACQISTISCDQGNPCQHGGSCKNVVGSVGIECECQPGYNGRFCEDDLDECANGNNPCRNGGLCQNLVSNL